MMNSKEIKKEVEILKSNFIDYKNNNKITKREYYDKLNDFIRRANNIKSSSCERNFEEIMKENDIYYIVELATDDLLSVNGNPVRIDFLLVSNYDDSKIVAGVEIDGSGHYSQNDKIKDDYYRKINIPLIRLTDIDLIVKRKEIAENILKLVNNKNLNKIDRNYCNFIFHKELANQIKTI